MTISLYDLSVGTFLQTVSGMQRVLKKGRDYAESNDIDPNTFVKHTLHDTMLPLLFQVNCLEMHSLDALQALRDGEFSPPKSTTPRDYQGLEDLVASLKTQLSELDPDEINHLAEGQVLFKFGEQEIPFTATNFILSFSLPNLQFHATTAYDILRAEGVPLGKADFLGKMRVGV